ncbi:class II fructose-bisphosphate aldolase, partial [Francisella tularensis subsp. holarctica]|uniref:class II fructose-bisphosphate aldolase n=1 Tax=Francisella tularensis TaxID=263 RepID=UPI002381B48B
AIKYSVRNRNIDTDIRIAATGAIRRYLAENPAEFDQRKYNAVAKAAMSEICAARYEAFGSAGMARKIKPISLEIMFKRYESGELDPIIK